MTESIFKIYPLEFKSVIEESLKEELIDYLKVKCSSVAAESIRYAEYSGIEFVDCGNRLKKINCNSCGRSIEHVEWKGIMHSDYAENHGYSMSRYNFGCCEAKNNLAALSYKEHCGFSKCILSFSVFSHFHSGWLKNYPWLGLVEARYNA